MLGEGTLTLPSIGTGPFLGVSRTASAELGARAAGGGRGGRSRETRTCAPSAEKGRPSVSRRVLEKVFEFQKLKLPLGFSLQRCRRQAILHLALYKAEHCTQFTKIPKLWF